jgi:uncharacterized ferritin-like protein (DUF455 family)
MQSDCFSAALQISRKCGRYMPVSPRINYQMIEDIDAQIKIERLIDVVFSRESEAVKVGGKYYCVKCQSTSGRITVLRELKSELYTFNCVYCSSIKKWYPEEST